MSISHIGRNINALKLAQRAASPWLASARATPVAASHIHIATPQFGTASHGNNNNLRASLPTNALRHFSSVEERKANADADADDDGGPVARVKKMTNAELANNNDGDEDHFDEAFERHIQDSVVWVDDGHFIDQSWVSLGESDPVKPDPERPLVLHTCLRHEEGSAKSGYSYAHGRHPFVAFLHLLDTAEPGSDFFMSIPFLGDFDAIDQLCHYANPEYGGLQIYIILGPKEWNVGTLEKFVGRSKSREEAVNRLHIKRFGHDEHWGTATYSHSKAMISSAGAMIGSYNLTGSARLRHTEHSVLLGSESNIEGLLNEFRQLWGDIKTAEIKISRTPSPTKDAPPDAAKVNNPYKKTKKIGVLHTS